MDTKFSEATAALGTALCFVRQCTRLCRHDLCIIAGDFNARLDCGFGRVSSALATFFFIQFQREFTQRRQKGRGPGKTKSTKPPSLATCLELLEFVLPKCPSPSAGCLDLQFSSALQLAAFLDMMFRVCSCSLCTTRDASSGHEQ